LAFQLVNSLALHGSLGVIVAALPTAYFLLRLVLAIVLTAELGVARAALTLGFGFESSLGFSFLSNSCFFIRFPLALLLLPFTLLLRDPLFLFLS
jgi:hypothetical protein